MILTVLCEYETWSLILREERRLRMFEKRVLRRIFGPKRSELIGDCRKLHNEELNDLHCSADIIRVIKSRRMRWAGHVARIGERKSAYRVLMGKLRVRDYLVDSGVDGRIILRSEMGGPGQD